jgi:ubiquinone/menaquinone biosynthesis C-methylase UbiE
MGRWSRAIGEKFLAWLAPPTNARWLDVGCGTGAFSELIQRRCAPQAIVGIDPSPQQIDYARKKFPGVTFQVGDSMDMKFGDSEFDVVASALVFHFIPDRAKAFAEMHRVLKPAGLVGGYTWKRSAAADFAPYTAVNRAAKQIGAETVSSATVPEGSEDGMRASLQAAGFRDIAITEIEVSQSFKNFEEYWEIQSLPFSPPRQDHPPARCRAARARAGSAARNIAARARRQHHLFGDRDRRQGAQAVASHTAAHSRVSGTPVLGQVLGPRFRGDERTDEPGPRISLTLMRATVRACPRPPHIQPPRAGNLAVSLQHSTTR